MLVCSQPSILSFLTNLLCCILIAQDHCCASLLTYQKNIEDIPYRYSNRSKFTVRGFYCIYIMFNIILYLFAWIEIYQIGLPVHNSMHKHNLWTSTKTTKDIKIINNILLPYYYHILRQSFGHQILWCNNDYNMNCNFVKTRKKNKSCCLCSTIRYYTF